MADTQKTIIAPDTYRIMCEPHESMAVLEKAWESFFEETREIRAKHRIADVLIVAEMNVITESGAEGVVRAMGSMGNSDNAERLAAFALGSASAEREQKIAELSKAKRK